MFGWVLNAPLFCISFLAGISNASINLKSIKGNSIGILKTLKSDVMVKTEEKINLNYLKYLN